MIKSLLGSKIAVCFTAWIMSAGVHIEPWWHAIFVAIVLGVINALVRPVAKILALPLTIVTLGLFILVINALMVMLCAWFLDSFTVDGFWWALGFSLVLSVMTWLVNLIFGK